MGQGFGKFVGSFMQQMQSEKGVGGSHPDQHRSSEPSLPEDRSVRSKRDGEDRSQQDPQRVYVPYRAYDPWGASRWGDPYLGYDPWARSRGWVDYDWQHRKRQYGRYYGGDLSPDDVGRPPGYGDVYRREMPWDVPFSPGFGDGRREWRDERYSPSLRSREEYQDGYSRGGSYDDFYPSPPPYRMRAPYDAYGTRFPHD